MPSLPLRPTVSQSVEWATTGFGRAGIESSRSDAEWLVSDLLGIGRADLALSRSRLLSPHQRRRLLAFAERRQRRVPLQQILGHTEFFSLPFRLSPDVLIPRPETEILVESLVDRVRALPQPRVLDVGTGSGAIAIAAASNLRQSRFVAMDLSVRALLVARDNARLNRVEDRIAFLRGDLLSPFLCRPAFDALAANLPYVSSDEFDGLQPEVRDHEPRLALDGGPDGLRYYRPLVRHASDLLHPGGWLAMEAGDGQARSVAGMVATNPAFHAPEIVPDLNGVERVVLSRRRT